MIRDADRKAIADRLEDEADRVMPAKQAREFRRFLARLQREPKQRKLI